MLPYNVTSGLERYPSAKRDYFYAKTASFSPSIRQTGATFSNLGATESITASLPTNSAGEKGLFFKFIVQAAYPIVIDPGAAGAFYVEGAKLADDANITLSTIGDEVTVTSDGNGDWVVSGYRIVSTTFEGQTTEAATDRTLFVATRPYRIVRASQTHSVAAGGASVIQLTKDDSTDAPGAGDNLLTNNTNTGFDLNATANTVQVGAFATTAGLLTLATGDRIGMDFANAIQSSAGVAITVDLINITF